jgi:DNA-binding response OmpR family regulator
MKVIDTDIKTILIVDDDPALCEFLNVLLTAEDFQVISTFRSAETLSLMKRDSYLRFNLIILDLQMPGLGGYSIIKDLQKEGFQDTPILVLTGRNLEQGTIDLICAEPNVRGLCKKPISAPELKKKVFELTHTKPRPKAALQDTEEYFS